MVNVLYGKQLKKNEQADAFARSVYEDQCHFDDGSLRYTKFLGVTAEFASDRKQTRSYRFAWNDWDPETLHGSGQIVITNRGGSWMLKCLSKEVLDLDSEQINTF